MGLLLWENTTVLAESNSNATARASTREERTMLMMDDMSTSSEPTEVSFDESQFIS